jgi:hypothetical protein
MGGLGKILIAVSRLEMQCLVTSGSWLATLLSVADPKSRSDHGGRKSDEYLRLEKWKLLKL